MRYAILSDIHANLPALRAVLTDIRTQGVDEILCLGDVVGYGPQPAEALQEAYTHIHHFVLGNHDAVICDRVDTSCFNARARALIDWTREQLDTKARHVFESMPYLIAGPGFRCAHANPVDPSLFGYVDDEEGAETVWLHTEDRLIFIGHTHLPGLYVLGRSGVPHWLEPRDFALESGKRYIVNVGSVGQPRNDDFRATYCIFDTAANSVFFRQVPFDLELYRRTLEASDMPDKSAWFLEVAEAAEPALVRDLVDFSPPQAADVPGIPEVEVLTLEDAAKHVRQWKHAAVAVGAVAAVLMVVALVLVFRGGDGRPYTEYAARMTTVWEAPAVGADCIRMPPVQGALSSENRLPNWTVRVSDPEVQQVETFAWSGSRSQAGVAEPAFRLRSDGTGTVVLRSPPVAATAGMRFELRVHGLTEDGFDGHMAMVLVQADGDGGERVVLHYSCEDVGADRWRFYRKMTDRDGLAEDGQLIWELRTRFKGELIVRNARLRRVQ